MTQQTITYLKDYTTPTHLVDTIHLLFDVFADKTRITSRLNVLPQQQNTTWTLAGSAKLLRLAINGKTLPETAYQLDTDKERLILSHLPTESFELLIETEVEPQKNKTFNGLYESQGNLYTQCEPEGFRTFTFHPDRPDVMSVFTTEIRADKTQFPVLLSNGNLIQRGDLADNRHFAIWHDPFAKPSYLFALVAGQLSAKQDVFTTQDGREIKIAFFTREHDIDKVDFAIESLKNAMKWDETRFGLAYDLDVFMVVAVSDFNMGAMENKGLNIFNTKYVLADAQTATDSDFEGVESVIGHEYFHNWTGNRITCRDWFQLSLKEGLTVFRDQEFSGDRASRAVRRIENVRVLRTHQFAEDASPMAHPVRPESYVEMNNFYTMTVYEKGAEVVRMYHTFLGEEGFQRGMRLYVARHDGQAVTCDDFRAAMSDANQMDFSQFALWYSQAGTPTLNVSGSLKDNIYTLSVQQILPETPDKQPKKAMMMPLKIALFNEHGEKIPFTLSGSQNEQTETVLCINQDVQHFNFKVNANNIIPSLLRGFSAPVHLRYEYSDDELALLLAHDDDAFARWEAGQTLFRRAIAANEQALIQQQNLPEHTTLLNALKTVLTSEITDPAFVACLLQVPAENELWAEGNNIDPTRLSIARDALLDSIARELNVELLANALNAREQENASKRGQSIAYYEYTPKDAGLRALQYACLAYVHRFDETATINQIYDYYDDMARKNMTHEWGILNTINHNMSDKRNQLLDRFAAKYANQELVMDKYFALIANSRRADTLNQVQAALKHPQFNLTNPNKVRALIGNFARNTPHFHAKDGSGYQFVAQYIREIDAFNPQIAANLAKSFSLLPRLESNRQTKMREQLTELCALPNLSKNTCEVVEKLLA